MTIPLPAPLPIPPPSPALLAAAREAARRAGIRVDALPHALAALHLDRDQALYQAPADWSGISRPDAARLAAAMQQVAAGHPDWTLTADAADALTQHASAIMTVEGGVRATAPAPALPSLPPPPTIPSYQPPAPDAYDVAAAAHQMLASSARSDLTYRHTEPDGRPSPTAP